MIVIKCPKCETTFQDYNYENVIFHGSRLEDDIYRCPSCRCKFKLNLCMTGKDGYGFIVGRPLTFMEKACAVIKTISRWISL